MSENEKQHEFPQWAFQLFAPKRYKVARGGRGSSKSWSIAKALTLIADKPKTLWKDGSRKKARILCGREYQNSIEESVHHLLADQIQRQDMSHKFDIGQRTITHRDNGSEFIFKGLAKNINTIKSFEDVDIFWAEEAELVSKTSWQTIVPTIRKPDSEIWVSYNPNEEDDETHVRFNSIKGLDPDSIFLMEVNWQDNPWFTETMRAEKDYLFRVDPEAAEHVWNGKCNTRSEAVVFRGKYVVESFEPFTGSEFDEENWRGPYFGSDWGFSTDPTTLTKLWISPRASRQKLLYVEKESWHLHLELDDIAKTWRHEIPEVDEASAIPADNSRPETINHVRKHGLYVVPCEKWSGSVEDGIDFLKTFEKIVIHPRCKHHIEEARTYKYKVDKLTGRVLRDIVDANNHCWDADRYALDKMIRGRRSVTEVL